MEEIFNQTLLDTWNTVSSTAQAVKGGKALFSMCSSPLEQKGREST